MRALAAIVSACICALLAPAGAGAATVVNGGFETGDLSGWQVFNSSTGGDWTVYTAADLTLIPEFFPPPSGSFAAITFEVEPDTAILYQDVALEPFFSHTLALTLYYNSRAPIVVPSPNSLATDGSAPANQQVRVDVMRPTAPIESLAPADILATVFANNNGDPEIVPPTRLAADLSAFAGQTVRLRIANAVHEAVFNTGLDDVSIISTPPPNAFSRGKLTLNKAKGTGKLAINVPGPGVLKAVDARAATAAASAARKPKRIKAASATPIAAGAVQIPLKPTGAGRKALKAKGKLPVKLRVTFTPTGGTASVRSFNLTLRLSQ